MGGARRAPRLRRAEPLALWRPRAASTLGGLVRKRGTRAPSCVLTGGLGGLGLHLSACLLNATGLSLVLASRSGRVARGGQGLGTRLEQLTYRFTADRLCLVAADSAHAAEVRALLRRGGDGPRLAGVVHLAHAIQEEPLAALSPRALDAELAAKARGAHSLHAAAAPCALSLNLLISSVFALGSMRTGAYAAANAYLDALASHASGGGARARSLQLPAIRGVGVAAASFGSLMDSAPVGLGAMALDAAHISVALDALLSLRTAAPPLLLPADGGRAADGLLGVVTLDSALLSEVRASAAAGAAPPASGGGGDVGAAAAAAVEKLLGSPLSPEAPLADAGLDSLLGMQLLTKLQAPPSVSTPSIHTFYSHLPFTPSIHTSIHTCRRSPRRRCRPHSCTTTPPSPPSSPPSRKAAQPQPQLQTVPPSPRHPLAPTARLPRAQGRRQEGRRRTRGARRCAA